MANNPITMNKVREILRLYTQGVSKLSISEQTGTARNTLKKYIHNFRVSGLTYDKTAAMSDKELDERFGCAPLTFPNERLISLNKLFPTIDKELKRKGWTKDLAWKKYINEYPTGYRFTQFCQYYSIWKKRVNTVMHFEHKAGDKMYIDYTGEKLELIDKTTGEIKEVEIFVSILGASQLIYVEASFTQKKEDFLGCIENALEYYGGVPAGIVPDNLRAAVTKSCKYEPTVNETFEDFASHYSTTVLPTRAYKPRDKSLVEGAVKIIYTTIFTKIREKEYSTIEEINSDIKIHREDTNNALMKGRHYSRRMQFDEIERMTLRPLPALRYEFKKRVNLTVGINGHIFLNEDRHYYSAPYAYTGKKVKVYYSRTTVEIFFHYQSIALHPRLRVPYGYSTEKDHLASTHRFIAEWSAERCLTWANSIDPSVHFFVEQVFARKNHPEQGLKSVTGLMNICRKTSPARLIKACSIAHAYGYYNYGIVKSIIEKEIDLIKEDVLPTNPLEQMPDHENIRGDEYYK